MTTFSIKQILNHEVQLDTTVTIKGWVRSKRASKAGFSFIHIHDGSCFDTIQSIADSNLEINIGSVFEVVIYGR